jgi:hypothetical protein
MLASREDEALSRAVIRAVEAQLSDLPVAFHVSWVARMPGDVESQVGLAGDEATRIGALAVFFCDALPPERVSLYVAAPTGGDLLRRRLEPSSAYAETLALIVRATVEVLLEEPEGGAALLEASAWQQAGGPPAAGASEASPLRPQERPPAARPDDGSGQDAQVRTPAVAARRRLAAGAAYQLEMWSRDRLAVHGIAVELDVRLWDGLHAMARYVFVFPFGASRDGVDIELSRHPIAVGLRYCYPIGIVELIGSMALVVDPVGDQVAVEEPMSEVEHSGEIEVGLLPGFELAVRPLRWLRPFIALGVAVPFTRVEYAIEQGPETRPVLTSWAARPWLMVGLSAVVL